MAETKEVVVRVGSSGYRAEISAGGHTLIADEPVAFGGTDQGPTPYDYLTAALGTCTAMTIRMYAENEDRPRAFYSNGRTFYVGLRGKL